MLDPEKGGGSGGGDPKPLSLEDRLAAAEQARDKANNDLNTVNGQISSLTKERDDSRAQFDELTKSAGKLQTDLKSANDQIATLTGERDLAKKDLGTANGDNARLRSLCSVKGIDANQAVPTGNESPADTQSTAAEWDKKLKEAKTPADRAVIMKEFSVAAKAGKIKKG